MTAPMHYPGHTQPKYSSVWTLCLESPGSHRIKPNKLASKVWVPYCVKYNSQCCLIQEFPWFSECVLQKELFQLISFRSRVLPFHTTTYIIIPRTFAWRNQVKQLPVGCVQPVQHCTLSSKQFLHSIVTFKTGHSHFCSCYWHSLCWTEPQATILINHIWDSWNPDWEAV